MPLWLLDLVPVLCAALAGAFTGSYLAMAAYRLPRRKSIGGRSACPSCGQPIASWCNIPVLSWLLLGGRSRCCQLPISCHYLLYEASCLLAGACAGRGIGLPVTVGVCLAAILFVAAVSVVSRARHLR